MDGGAFSQEFEGDDSDPFAAADQEFAQEQGADAALAADAAMEAERTGGEALPVVNKEGERVERSADAPTQVEGQADPFASSDAPAASTAEQAQQPSPAARDAAAPAESQGAASPSPASATSEISSEAMHSGDSADPRPAATAGEPSAAPVAAGEPGDTEGPTSESSEAPGAEAGAESAGEGTAGDGEDEVAAAPTAAAKDSRRKYVLFTPDGNGKFTEVSWHEDKAGNVVPRGQGTKKQTIVLARGQEDALHFGFGVMGKPQGGCKLVAVAETYWQVRHIEPDPDPPVRQKLKIS